MPVYISPEFSLPDLLTAPARIESAAANGVVPDGFHATSNHPEYVHLGGYGDALTGGDAL
jgi:hypothetical protein